MERKKKVRRILAIALPIILLFFIFVPIFKTVNTYYGATAYSCIAYTVVKWDRTDAEGTKVESTVVYWFPENTKRFDELWRIRH